MELPRHLQDEVRTRARLDQANWSGLVRDDGASRSPCNRELDVRVTRRVLVPSVDELRTYLRRVEVDHSEQWRAPAQLLAATQSGRLLGSATLLLPLTGTADDLQEQKIDATTCRKRSSKQFPGRVHCVDAVSRQLSVSFRTQQRWRQVRAGRQRISSRHQLQATGTSHARAPCLPVRHAGWRTTLLQRCVSNRRMRG